MKEKRKVIGFVLTTLLILFILIVTIINKQVSWEGKSISFIGDSITENSLYPEIVKSELGLTSNENYGIGGSTYCLRYNEYDDLYVPLINRWQEVEKSDTFFILMGTNDYSSQVPLGEANSTDKGEFNGCLNIIINGLQEKYPNSQIIISTLLKRRNDNLPITLTDYNNVIKKKAKEFNLVLFDGYNIKELDIGKDYNGVITDDRLHPNENGAKILGQTLAEFLKTVKP